TVAPLTRRDRIAQTILALCSIIPRAVDTSAGRLYVVSALHEPVRSGTRHMRLAIATGAYKEKRNCKVLPDDFLALMRESDTLAARCALGLSGEPVAPWAQLSREERACVVLAAICDGMHR